MREVEVLWKHNRRLAKALKGLFGETMEERVLSSEEKALILFGLYAAYGSEEDVIEQGRTIMEVGAATEAILEIILTSTISRGPRTAAVSRGLLSQLTFQQVDYQEQPPTVHPLAYFMTEFDSLPSWVQALAEFSPTSLECYAVLRQAVLADGAVMRKTKELLTMGLNAIGGNSTGIRSHAKKALHHGAGREELLETLLLCVKVGGIVAWINGIDALGDPIVGDGGSYADATST